MLRQAALIAVTLTHAFLAHLSAGTLTDLRHSHGDQRSDLLIWLWETVQLITWFPLLHLSRFLIDSELAYDRWVEEDLPMLAVFNGLVAVYGTWSLIKVLCWAHRRMGGQDR